MTLSEDEYSDLVEEMLIAQYGSKNVEREYYLDDVERYVDFIVWTWPVDMAIEVENDFEATFTGVGQALLYASESSEMTPVIIRPPLSDGSDRMESDRLSKHVSIKEFEPKTWYSEQ